MAANGAALGFCFDISEKPGMQCNWDGSTWMVKGCGASGYRDARGWCEDQRVEKSGISLLASSTVGRRRTGGEGGKEAGSTPRPLGSMISSVAALRRAGEPRDVTCILTVNVAREEEFVEGKGSDMTWFGNRTEKCESSTSSNASALRDIISQSAMSTGDSVTDDATAGEGLTRLISIS